MRYIANMPLLMFLAFLFPCLFLTVDFAFSTNLSNYQNQLFMRILTYFLIFQKSVPLSPGSQKRTINHSQIGNDKGYLWKMSCLRPAPPTRSYLSQPGDTAGGAKRSSGSTKKGK